MSTSTTYFEERMRGLFFLRTARWLALVTSAAACSTSSDAPGASANTDAGAPDPRGIYVSPTGDDAAPGTMNAPLRHVQRALDRAAPGQTVHLFEGTYDETSLRFAASGTEDAPITLRSVAGQRAVLGGHKGMNGEAVLVIDGRSHVRVTGITVRGFSCDAVDKGCVGILLAGECDDVRIAGNLVESYSGFNTGGILGAGASLAAPTTRSYFTRVVIEDNEVRDYDKPRIDDTSSGEGYGIALDASGKDVVIRRNHVHHGRGYAARGIDVFGGARAFTKVLVESNDLHDLAPWPSESMAVAGNVSDFEIVGNTVHDTDFIGIDVVGGYGQPAYYPRNGTVKKNLTYRNFGKSDKSLVIRTAPNVPPSKRTNGGGIGIYVDGADSVLVEANVTHSNGEGMQIGSEISERVHRRIDVVNNVIYANAVRGVFMGWHPNTKGAGSGSTDDSSLVNNTLVGNGFNHDIDSAYGSIVLGLSRNVVITNNIVVAPDERLFVRVGDAFTPGLVMDHNLYYTLAAKPRILVAASETSVVTYESLADYAVAMQKDAQSLFGNPLFVAPDAANFRLREGSPAIGAGSAVTGQLTATDIEGKPRGARPDIGAYQR